MKVTFIGHADTPYSVKEKLKEAIISLITEHGADTFYVGNQGNFDRMTIHTLEEKKGKK